MTICGWYTWRDGQLVRCRRRARVRFLDTKGLEMWRDQRSRTKLRSRRRARTGVMVLIEFYFDLCTCPVHQKPAAQLLHPYGKRTEPIA